MNFDLKIGPTSPLSQREEKSIVSISKILDFSNPISKSWHEKQENSELNEEVKRTSRNSIINGDAYSLNLFDIIQNSIFKADQFASIASEKEHHQELVKSPSQERNRSKELVHAIGIQRVTSNPEVPMTQVDLIGEILPRGINNNSPTEVQNPIDHTTIFIGQGNRLENSTISPLQQQQQQQQNANSTNLQEQNDLEVASPANSEAGHVNKKILRQLEFYFITFSLAVLGYIVLENYVALEILLLVFIPWLAYLIYRAFKKQAAASSTARQKRAKYFALAELFFIVIYMIVSVLKLQDIRCALAPATIPGFLNLIPWLLYSDSPSHSSCCGPKTRTGFKRLFLWTQLLLVGLKADDKLDSWSKALSLTYYLLFIFVFYCILVFFIFLSALLGCRRIDSSYKLNLMGFGWYFLVSLYSGVWLNLLINAIGVLDETKTKGSLGAALFVGMAHSVLLIVYAVLLRKELSRFLRSESNAFTTQRNSAQQEGIERYVRFEVAQGDMPYLITISPTFYVQMQMKEAFKLDNQNSLLDWVRRIRKEKTKKYTRARSQAETISQQNFSISVKPIPRGVKFAKEVEKSKTERLQKSVSLIDLQDQDQSRSVQISKVCYSLDDLAIYENIKKPVDQKNGDSENDKVCYVCFERNANAVFMKCGHGGVCYNCAIEHWKKTDKCVMCRQKIDTILKVSTIDKLKISKVIHMTKKIVGK